MASVNNFHIPSDGGLSSGGRPMLPGRPQCGRYPAAESARDEPIGAGTHTGYGNLTLHASDDVGGLELRTRAGKAPALPGAFVVNIGDCLMRWTNDVYVSNSPPSRQSQPPRALLHRLLLRPQSRRGGRRHPHLCRRGAKASATRPCSRPTAGYLKFRLDASEPDTVDRTLGGAESGAGSAPERRCGACA